MSLKLGLHRNKNKLCSSEFCKYQPSHSDSENNLKNQLLDNFLQPQLSQALLEQERDFRWNYSSAFEKTVEQTARSHANRNRFNLGQHLEISRKVIYQNQCQDLCNSQKLQQCRFGPFTTIKRITKTTYQIQDNNVPANRKTVHRNHIVDYSPKEKTLPPMIEENVPMDRSQDDFYERIMEQRIQKLNNSQQSSMEDSVSFPIESTAAAPVTLPRKRVSIISSVSGVNSPHVLSLATPIIPNISQPYLIPSISRVNPPNGSSTQFNNFLLLAVNPRTWNLNINVPSPIILIHSMRFEPALDKATNFQNIIFCMKFIILTNMGFCLWELKLFLLRFLYFLFYSRSPCLNATKFTPIIFGTFLLNTSGSELRFCLPHQSILELWYPHWSCLRLF